MTSVQWDAYKEILKGAHVERWEGWVGEVDEFAGLYALTVDMDHPSAQGGTYLVCFEVSETNALNLDKHMHVAFEGDILDVNVSLGRLIIDLEDASFLAWD